VWKAVSIDPITGASRTSGAYWKRIKTDFDDLMIVHPDYNMMFMSQTQKAKSTWWEIIQHSVNLFHVYFENIRLRQESGVDAARELDHEIQMYQTDVKKEFKLMHCFISLKQCKKLRQTWVLLKKAVEGIIDLDVLLGPSVGRLIGNKRAKAAATGASSSERMTSSIDKGRHQSQCRPSFKRQRRTKGGRPSWRSKRRKSRSG
jgi:hypothetical protein